jgi:hypothetical protein
VAFTFRPATRKKSRLRMALDGPAGSGKTFSALRFAFAAGAKRVAVINTESGAVEKYMGLAPDGIPWNFFVGELDIGNFSPSAYTEAIQFAGKNGFDWLIIDSLSHAWQGDGGALDQVSRKGGNSYTAWKDVTPQHNRMVEAILRSPCHVIVTMRSKMEYVLEEQANREGRTVQVPRKIGMAPIQRAGMEYEFDVVADLDHTHTLTVSKSRCPDVDGLILVKPGPGFIEPIMAWLAEGTEVEPGFYTADDADLKTPAAHTPTVAAPADWREAARQRTATAGGDVAGAAAEQPAPVAPVEVTAPIVAHPDGSGTATIPAEDLKPISDAIASTPPAEELPVLVSPELAARIESLFAALKTPVDVQIGILARKGVESPNGRPRISLLPADQAAELAKKLEAMLEADRAKELGLDTLPAASLESARTGLPEGERMADAALDAAVDASIAKPTGDAPEKKKRGRPRSNPSPASTAAN